MWKSDTTHYFGTGQGFLAYTHNFHICGYKTRCTLRLNNRSLLYSAAHDTRGRLITGHAYVACRFEWICTSKDVVHLQQDIIKPLPVHPPMLSRKSKRVSGCYGGSLAILDHVSRSCPDHFRNQKRRTSSASNPRSHVVCNLHHRLVLFPSKH